jgi:hypothetical protein
VSSQSTTWLSARGAARKFKSPVTWHVSPVGDAVMDGTARVAVDADVGMVRTNLPAGSSVSEQLHNSSVKNKIQSFFIDHLPQQI